MTYISNSMQSFMPIDLRASQFVRGNANFLAKNATRDIGLDKEVSFRKYNADVKELDALAGSMDKLAAQLETHLGELGEVEEKLNGIRDIIATVKEADDLHAADPLNNPALDQSVRDDYQRQINTFFSEIEDIVSTTKVFGKNVFDGYFNLGSIGDNKNESFDVNLSQGYISAANNSAYTAAGKVSSTGQFGRDFAMEGNYILISANNQNNIANGTTANSGQGAVMLYNKTNLTSPQTTYTLDYNTYLYRDKFGLSQNFGTRVTMDSNASRGANADLVAIAMSDQADPTYQVGDNILDRNTGNLTYWTADTRALNTDGTLKKTNITYSVGQNIYDANGEKLFYTAATRAFNTDGSYKMQTTGTYALGNIIKNSDGTNAVYTSVDDLRMFNADGSRKVVTDGTYSYGETIKNLDGTTATYSAVDDRRMFNADGTQTIVNQGTYSLGATIVDYDGNAVTYTGSDDLRKLNTDGSYKVISAGTYSVGDTVKNLDGTDATYTASDDLRMFNSDGSQKVVSSGTYNLGDNIKNLDGSNATYTVSDDLRKLNTDGSYKVVNSGTYANVGDAIYNLDGTQATYDGTEKVYNIDGSWDGVSYHNAGDLKTVEVDSSLASGSQAEADGAIMTGSNIQSYDYHNVGDLKKIEVDSSGTAPAGVLKAGDTRSLYGFHSVGDTKVVEISSTGTAPAGVVKAGSTRQSYDYHAIGDVKKIEVNSSGTPPAGVLKAGDNIQRYGFHAVGATKTVQIDGAQLIAGSAGALAGAVKSGDTRSTYGMHNIGDVKRIELDRAQVLANPTNPGYTVLMNADSNYNSALINSSTNVNHLNGIKAAGDSIRTHVMHNAGDERKIELASTASTTSVGFVQTGFRAGMSGIRQEYNLAGSVKRVELGSYSSLVAGSPGKIAADLAVSDPGFLPNQGDRKMGQEHGGAVYLYKQDGTLLREFKPGGLRDGDNFGSEIVIEGNKIFIGAAGDDAGGSNAGAVYVFDINTGNQLAKINGSTANAGVGSVNSITGDNGIVAIGRLTGSGGKDKVDFYNANSLNVVRSLEGATAGDKFGYSMEMKGDEILISSYAANGSDGRLALYDATTGNIVNENGEDVVINYTNPGENPGIGFHGVDFSADYLVAKGSNNLIYTFNRGDKALKTVNVTSIGEQEFAIEGNNLLIGEYDGSNRVGSYDVTSIPTTEDLNMSLTLHDTAYGLSATLPQAISSISVSDQVNSFTGVIGDNVASGFDLLSMDTALKNFANMKQSYESQISRVKKRSEDILERRDKIASVQAFDEDNVSKILNTVYGSQPFDLSSIMQPFDKGIVSSLLP